MLKVESFRTEKTRKKFENSWLYKFAHCWKTIYSENYSIRGAQLFFVVSALICGEINFLLDWKFTEM